MNRFRDFLYKQNDIIIVLIILAAAALLIYNRVTLIMDYPHSTAAQNRSETTQELNGEQASGEAQTEDPQAAAGETDQ